MQKEHKKSHLTLLLYVVEILSSKAVIPLSSRKTEKKGGRNNERRAKRKRKRQKEVEKVKEKEREKRRRERARRIRLRPTGVTHDMKASCLHHTVYHPSWCVSSQFMRLFVESSNSLLRKMVPVTVLQMRTLTDEDMMRTSRQPDLQVVVV